MLTVDQIIEEAMRELGELPFGESPTAAEYADSLVRLNTLIASIRSDTPQTDTKTITLVDGESDYVTAENTKRVVNFSDSTINIMSPSVFDVYGSSYAGGKINVMVDYSTIPPVIKFGIAATADNDGIEYTYRREFLPDELSLGESPSFKEDVTDVLILGLAYRIAPMFGVSSEKRMEIKQDYLEQLSVWKANQAYRGSLDIVSPPNVI